MYSAFLKTHDFILIRVSIGLLNNLVHSLLNLYKKQKSIKSMPQFNVDSTPCNLDIFGKTLLLAHTCNPSTCKSEAGGLLLILCQPGLHSKTLSQNNTVKLKGEKNLLPGENTHCFPWQVVAQAQNRERVTIHKFSILCQCGHSVGCFPLLSSTLFLKHDLSLSLKFANSTRLAT